MTSQRQSFRLHLPGLLKVLAEHLYADRHVAVRELIQNAHDSCVRRSLEMPEAGYRPRIEISADPVAGTVTVSDNGCGLTADEIDSYLTTIGRSYTRDLRDRLALMSWEEASRLIGQFGFGFLSAFLIASEVTLITRSARPGSGALRWWSSGDEHYEVAAGERAQSGTTVVLTIKPAAAFLLQTEQLTAAVQRYADFLPDPIFVGGARYPANLMSPPWEASDRESAMVAYVERAFHMEEPLALFALRDEEVALEHDTASVPLRGFLFIPPSTSASVREYGDLRVYIRGMFICDEERHLLPPWARFVRGVLDCPILQPTASREAIHQDDVFLSVRSALESQLVSGLRQIAAEQPGRWRQIVRAHADLLISWAASDPLFFDQIADLVPLPTSRGRLTLPELVALTGGVLLYSTEHLGSLQDRVLAEGRNTAVIDASWMGIYPFLHQYAQRQPGLRLEQLDGDVRSLLRPVEDARFAALLDACRAAGVRARIAVFSPEDLPAVMVYPPNMESLIEMRAALRDDELPAPFAALVGDYLIQRPASDDELRGTLYLNAGNQLIQDLAARPAGAAERAAVTMIVEGARLFAGRGMAPADVAAVFRSIAAALRELLP